MSNRPKVKAPENVDLDNLEKKSIEELHKLFRMATKQLSGLQQALQQTQIILNAVDAEIEKREKKG